MTAICNESTTRKKLLSRPGYLQIFHDPANSEVPANSINIVPSTRADPASLEYLAGTEERHDVTDKDGTEERHYVTDKDVKMIKPEPVQLLSTTVTTSKLDTHKSTQVHKVEPYAVVDMIDIVTTAGLDNTVTKHKSKHQRNKHVPTNREALILSFGTHTDDSITTQVELNGRFCTVPLYVNLHIPMTINPSYK